MRNNIIQSVHNLFIFFLTIMLVLICTSCGLSPVATTDKPQVGDWKAEFSFKDQGEKKENYHWEITFTVNEGAETVSSMQILHYYGERTSDTQASFMVYMSDISLDKNSFEFSFTEWHGYTSDTYKGTATFTSATEAQGTINIDDTEYKWTATPVNNH